MKKLLNTIKEKGEIIKEIKKLKSLRTDFLHDILEAEDKIKLEPGNGKHYRDEIRDLKASITSVEIDIRCLKIRLRSL